MTKKCFLCGKPIELKTEQIPIPFKDEKYIGRVLYAHDACYRNGVAHKHDTKNDLH